MNKNIKEQLIKIGKIKINLFIINNRIYFLFKLFRVQSIMKNIN